jgi:glucose-1-phosphate thymidylyltransferase
MKGIILAGGVGSRLGLLTRITNKHLLPVYDKPMICYPVETLKKAGLEDILIVSGKEYLGHICEFLGSGKEWEVDFTYKVQDEAGGIPQAIALAEGFSNQEKIVVHLGDNVFEDNIKKYVNNFKKQGEGARTFLKEVDLKSAKRFGIAEVSGDKVTYVIEKPENPTTNLAMTGLYMFDSTVYDVIRNLKFSDRNELEITETLDHYVQNGTLGYDIIKGFWSDAGTFESLYHTAKFIRDKK